MAKSMPDEVDPLGFEENLSGCESRLQEIAEYLRTTAMHVGADVLQRRYRHAAPNTGWGVTYYSAGRPFCQLHPKRGVGHVWVFVSGVDSAAVVAEGFEPSKQASWFQIRTMPEAVRFVKWIVWAHDQRR